MRLFRIYNIDIKLNYMMLIICGMAVYSSYFSHFLLLMIIIVIHELTHALVSNYYGIEVSEIEIFPFGGVAKTGGLLALEYKQEIIISLVGPLSNFTMLIIALIVADIIRIELDLLRVFIEMNLKLGCFNLIPILPLDGGRVVRAWLNIKIGFKRATAIMICLGRILSLIIFIWGLYSGVKYMENFILSGLGIFLLFALEKEKEGIGYIFIYKIIMKRKKLLEKGFMEAKYITALENIKIYEMFQEFHGDKYHFVTVLNTEGKIMDNLTEGEILDGNIKYGTEINLGELIELIKYKGGKNDC